MPNCLVFDIGKTHIKWHVLDSQFQTLAVEQTENYVTDSDLYPHFDVDNIWTKFIECVKHFDMVNKIDKICVTTHGATAALINRHASGNGLILPIMDYEYDGIDSINELYQRARPPFLNTGSPNLPAGLNLGKQLFWQCQNFPEQFDACTDILLYPQYWLWRMTGQCYTEISSLGCHTDLWNPWKNDFSSLAQQQLWHQKFPPLKKAWDIGGTISQELQDATGLPKHCEVHVGVHDSNASYLRYKKAESSQPFSIISTGTWSIAMNSHGDSSSLVESQDTLINIDVWGKPILCSRFMGGREYSAICNALGGSLDAKYSEIDINTIILNNIFCLPCWAHGSGPFPQQTPSIQNQNNVVFIPAALASLYCALVLDFQLDLIGARGDIIVSGAFLKNNTLCQILAQLRVNQTVKASSDDTGTVMGAASLTDWLSPSTTPSTQIVPPLTIKNLSDYKNTWRQLTDSKTSRHSI
jgi:sugar (pentulose or hexulose) kinase